MRRAAALLLAIAGCRSAPQPRPEHVTFNVKGPPSQSASLRPESLVMWPPSVKPIPDVTRRPDGTLAPQPPASLKVAILVTAAEREFQQQKYDEAKQAYQEALDSQPDYAAALIGLGDCAFHDGDYAAAEAYLRRAHDATPLDHLPLFLLADTLDKLGRYDEAREALTESLELRPRNKPTLVLFHRLAPHLDVAVRDEPFEPKAIARLENGELGWQIAKDAGANGVLWSLFATCELFGPADDPASKIRLEHLQPISSSWTLKREVGCVAELAQLYREAIPKGGAQPELALEALAALEPGELEGFVLYEIAPRMDPHIALRLPEALRAELRDYVRKHVVPVRGDGPRQPPSPRPSLPPGAAAPG